MTNRMPRGAIPTPRSELAGSEPFREEAGAGFFVPSGGFPSPNQELAAASPYKSHGDTPENFLVWPSELCFWGNDQENNSIWAEEAFAKACADPRIFIPTGLVLSAAGECGSSNFSQFMQTRGFRTADKAYVDGPFYSLDWTKQKILQNAVYNHGPVKVGVGAETFKSNEHGFVTPGVSGWAMHSYPKFLSGGHCASLCGFGNLVDLVELFRQHQVIVESPERMPTGMCYAMFTWGSIGIVDEQSMLNMTFEAWVRHPVTIVKVDGVNSEAPNQE